MTNTGYPYDDWYQEYQNLGGKKIRKEYDNMVDIFHDHTSFQYGVGTQDEDPHGYDDRLEAYEGCQKILHIDDEEMNRLFRSIDNVTAYT